MRTDDETVRVHVEHFFPKGYNPDYEPWKSISNFCRKSRHASKKWEVFNNGAIEGDTVLGTLMAPSGKSFGLLPLQACKDIAEEVNASDDETEKDLGSASVAATDSESHRETGVIDRGHKYRLMSLDGVFDQTLTFVKRLGEKYPGNEGRAYPGTNLQSVLRACVDRVCYLQGQIPCDENIAIINNLRDCLYLLEHRAMRRHGLDASTLTHNEASLGAMCPICGHVRCNHQGSGNELETSTHGLTTKEKDSRAGAGEKPQTNGPDLSCVFCGSGPHPDSYGHSYRPPNATLDL